MDRMKTFIKYLLIFLGFFVISFLLMSAYIKTSYHKIESYEIKEDKFTVTILSAKSSKDNGYIEGNILNKTEEKISNKYMKVELFSGNDVNLGEEYVKIDEMNPGDLKNFRVSFSCDNVKHFKVYFMTQEEKEAEDASKDKSLLPRLKTDENVDKFVDSISPKFK
ncbi:MAG: FxLYD domain-containing protein [Clostridia bacterium]|nr:FxLYD domain-containing protein [Clostridia bacterium]